MAEIGDTNEILESLVSHLMIAKLHGTHFVWQSYFIPSLFCTCSGEGSSFLCEIENVYQPIAHYRANGF